MSATDRLLRHASLRLVLARAGQSARRGFIIGGIVLFIGLLGARLLAAIPSPWFTPLNLACAIAGATVIAAAFCRRPSRVETARAVDHAAGSKELFLSVATPAAPGSTYHPIVVEQAETKAAVLKPAALLPWHPARGLRDMAIVAAAIAAAYLWLPQLDPFDREAARQEVAKRERRLEETKQITVARKEQLAEKSQALTEQVEAALAKLDQTLKQAKPTEKEVTAKKLNEEAQDFSELWKRVSDQLPKNAGEQWEKAAQAFGDAKQQEAIKEMISQLKKGDANSLKEALQKLQEQMKEIAKQPAGAEQRKQLEALAREVAKLGNQLKEQLGDKGVNEALQRALEQMDMAQLKELAKDALDAANESLQLSQQELEKMAEMFKNMENVQDALKNLQAAKQLNEQGKLDGKDAQAAGAESQGDYEKLFEKLMAERGGGQPGEGGQGGQGNQPGQGRSGNAPGVGQGGTVGEDPNAKTATKEEKAKTQLGAGKLLMQWKEEGIGEIGNRQGDYQAAVRAVKEGVSEAIRNEQVPPGYHSAIQRYFDRLPTETPKK
jgi:hypothetical protein